MRVKMVQEVSVVIHRVQDVVWWQNQHGHIQNILRDYSFRDYCFRDCLTKFECK